MTHWSQWWWASARSWRGAVVLAFIKANAPVRSRQVGAALGVDMTTINTTLRGLRSGGLITDDAEGFITVRPTPFEKLCVRLEAEIARQSPAAPIDIRALADSVLREAL